MAGNSTFTSSPMESPASEKDAKALEFIEGITKNADAIQRDVLTKILTQNEGTEYLKGFNLEGASDRETFKSKIPMVTYEDIKPLIQRIANGDASPILCAQPISEFLTSSGTSGGEWKLIPITEGEWDHRQIAFGLIMPIMNQYVKGLDKGKALYFTFTKSGRKTPGGLVAQPASTSFYQRFNSLIMKTRPHDQNNVYTSPFEAILCSDHFPSMYAQMLCGLYHREQVIRVGSVFASTFVRAISFLQLNWKQLTHDIRTGSLNPKVTDTSIRECMTRVMRPEPQLADFISQECAKDNWEGIITRIWPNTKYLDTIVTGTMSQYISNLDYYSGRLPIVCTRLASSECFIGINLNPMCKPSEVSYTIMPNMAYFEFLPDDPNSLGPTHPKLVDLVEVEIGKEYELVVTTYTGLYRYRMGDILRVTGFHNSVPQFQFVRRRNVLLSIDRDKTDEAELQVAVQNASQLLHEFNTSVLEYTSYADTTTIPGHYVIYWELLVKESTNSPSDKVLDQCCLAMEESFSTVYRRCRAEEDNSIGPLEIRVVKNGAFEKLMDYAISRGASMGQYKVPRCVCDKPMLDLLDSQVISTHISPSSPHWSAK